MSETLAHSELGASSMYRWSACPASVNACRGITAPQSPYALEGTHAHALAAFCLENEMAPEQFIDRAFDDGHYQFTPSRDMAEAVQLYVDTVLELKGDDGFLHIETRFDLSNIYPGCFGTADAVIWKAKPQELIVIDYKHGAGIPVNPEHNPQLQYYGLGAAMNLKYPAKTVNLVIVQPRCGGDAVRAWPIDAMELIEFCASLVGYAEATAKPDALFVPGDHCRFCPKAPTCDALNNRAQTVARMEFKATLPYDPQKLKLALDSRPALQAFLKNLDEFAYAEAEAGRCPLGYKLVAKKATRKWRNEMEAKQFFTDKAIKLEDIMEEPSLLSPAKTERILGKGVIDEMVVKESSGHALVPEDDPRPAAVPKAHEEFTRVN